MKKLLLKISSITVLIILLIILLTIFVDKLILKNANFKLKSNINTVIIGHSHPQYSLNDEIIQNSVNLSYSLDTYFHSYIKLKHFVNSNNQIKFLFVEYSNNCITEEMDNAMFNKNSKPKIVKYLPFMNLNEHFFILKNNPIVYSESKINSLSVYFRRLMNKEFDFTKEFGRFEPNNTIFNDTLLLKTKSFSPWHQKTFSFKNIYYLKKIISFCKTKKINLYLIRSPLHKKWVGRTNEYFYFKIKKIYFPKVALLDFSNFKLLNDEFSDFQHLQKKGAIKFSTFANLIINKIRFNKILTQEKIDSLIKEDYKI